MSKRIGEEAGEELKVEANTGGGSEDSMLDMWLYRHG